MDDDVTISKALSLSLLAAIQAEGLTPMARPYVHLAADAETAVLVGAASPAD